MTQPEEPKKKLADVAFESALHDLSSDEANESIEGLIARFEAAVQQDGDGNEFWFARDLQLLLGYSKWDNFLTVISRAKSACDEAGHSCDDHFAGVGKMVQLGSGAEREIEDIILSRYASYLVAQNGDGRKQQIAFAQTYFAIQTRKQEITEAEDQEYLPLSEDERRILLRDEIKTHNKSLASAAKSAGVRQGVEFAVF